MSIDLAALTQRVASLDRILKSHAGGVTLGTVHDDGRVEVKLTGMCVGCELRPVTLATVIEPALSSLAGVTGIETSGGRLSEHAISALQSENSVHLRYFERVIQQIEQPGVRSDETG